MIHDSKANPSHRWAWQNTHLTRHIPEDERITQKQTVLRISSRTGRARRKIARPRMSLTDKLSNLHVLLRVKSFERWPLEVTFFAEDVFKVWRRWSERTCFTIRRGINVKLAKETDTAIQLPNTSVSTQDGSVNDHINTSTDALKPLRGIEAIDVGYGSCKSHLEKSQSLLEADTPVACRVCMETIQAEGSPSVVCPERDCEMVSHLICLSQAFLAQGRKADALVPTEGNCPGCQAELSWSVLVRDLSLRMRGQKEIDALFKTPRQRKTKVTTSNGEMAVLVVEQTARDAQESESATDDDDSEDEAPQFIVPRSLGMVGLSDGEDDWVYRQDDYTEEVASTAGAEREATMITRLEPFPERNSSTRVIEDSDWDDAEILD